MADIRIKDLATLESASLTGDVFVIDGTTGTRKLSAFSPSFGGNATVTGTLTANSTSSFADRITLRKDVAGNVEQLIDNRNTAGGEVIYLSEDGLSTEYAYIARYNSAHATTSKRKALEFGVNGTGAFYNFASGVLKVSDTTASTTTSTGALVVSGGVGVAGAIYAGGNIVNTGVLSATSSATTLTNVLSNTLTAATNVLNLQLRRGDSANGFSRLMWNTGSTTEWSFGSRAGDTNLYVWDEVANAERLKIASSTGNVSIAAITASTSTSSGALVVGNGTSGGLGVGGSINAGGSVTISGSNGYAVIGGRQWSFRANSSGGSPASGCVIRDDSAAADRLTIDINGNTSVLSTTASTSTSSGALVVSGGVGVAGAIVTGGIVRCGGSNGLSLGSDTGNIRIDSAGPAGVEFRGLSAADTITGFTMREMALIDGTAAPSTRAGYATIYVDSADGDLKVKFGDGTVKTIATDS